MQLFWTPASPFTRKVSVAARELDLWERIEVRPTTWTLDWGYTTPRFTPGLAEANPVARIPTLITDEGIPLGDSTVICLHLNEVAAPRSLIPADKLARQRMWSCYAVADGMLEAQIAMRAEMLRPEALRSESFLEKQRARIRRCLDTLEQHVAWLEGPVDLANITGAIACGYQDWREWLFDFRPGHPRLADWYARYAERPAMKVTEPKETPTA
ncbi:MAG: glutathione S-transferase family protein [Hyphomicrobiaceae bacterium]|nr:glutathione S-transferase family protein [Hyphomicrobiaceae bacterium]